MLNCSSILTKNIRWKLSDCYECYHTMRIKWGKISSTYFNVFNGVGQGAVLSPKMFAVYCDDLSLDIAMCKSGCYINDQCMNHVMYSDVICLLAPRAIGLQRMVDVCLD